MATTRLRLGASFALLLAIVACGGTGADETESSEAHPVSGREQFLGRWMDDDGWVIQIDATTIRVVETDGSVSDQDSYRVTSQSPNRLEAVLQTQDGDVPLVIDRTNDGIGYHVSGQRILLTPFASSTAEAAAAPNATAVYQLNEACADTWCEGELDWSFTALSCEATTCTLSANTRAYDPEQDALTAPEAQTLVLSDVPHVMDPEQADMVSERLFEAVGEAIAAFENQGTPPPTAR